MKITVQDGVFEMTLNWSTPRDIVSLHAILEKAASALKPLADAEAEQRQKDHADALSSLIIDKD